MSLPKLNLKAVIKTFVLAPAGAALSFVITNILYADAVSAGALNSSQSFTYPLIVAGVVFAIIVITGLDEMFVE